MKKPFFHYVLFRFSFHMLRPDFRLLSRVRYFFPTDRLVTVISERPQKFPRNQLNSHRIARDAGFRGNFPLRASFPLNFSLGGDFVLCHFVIEIFSYTFSCRNFFSCSKGKDREGWSGDSPLPIPPIFPLIFWGFFPRLFFCIVHQYLFSIPFTLSSAPSLCLPLPPSYLCPTSPSL